MAEYIEREALMDRFRKHMVEHHDREKCVAEENCKTCDRGCLWRKIVMNAPAADVAEVKRGEWIFGYCGELSGTDAPLYHKCSLCGGEHTDEWDFCPNCGAKMKG